MQNTDLACYYNTKPNTVSSILKRKSEYLSIFSSELEKKRFRQPMYKEIDDAVILALVIPCNYIITQYVILVINYQFSLKNT